MRQAWNTVQDIKPGDWRWTHVSAREWACKGSGRVVIETEYMDRLELLRTRYGRPLYFNSCYRSPEYNAQVSDTGGSGPHTTARACDIRVYGADALQLIGVALATGFTGIGIAQKGATSTRFVHLDDLPGSDTIPRPMIWSY